MKLSGIQEQFFFGYKKRIVVSFLLFLFLIVGSLVSYGIITDRRIIMSHLEENGIYLARNLASNSESGVYSEYIPMLNVPLKAILAETNARWAAVYTLEGRAVAHAVKERQSIPPLPGDIIASIKTWKRNEVRKRETDSRGADVLDFYTPVYLRKRSGEADDYSDPSAAGTSEVIGIARVGMSLEAPAGRARDVLTASLIFTAVYLMLGAFAIMLIVREITRPVRRLSDAAREVGRGNLGLRIDSRSKDELGTLAHAFNQMTEDLAATIERLKISEEEVRRRGDFLERLLDHANSIIIEVDDRGAVTRFNRYAGEFFGWPQEKAIGASLASVVIPGAGPERAGALESNLRASSHFELAVTAGKGKESLVSWINTPIRTAEGGHRGNLLIGSDITEQKKMEEQIRHSQKIEAIGTLAGGIAHDFNNILGAIIGYTELVQGALPGDPSTEYNLSQVLKAADRAKNLVRQILAFSRKTDRASKPLQMHLVVGEAVKLLRATIPTTVDIRTDIARRDDTVVADPTQLHQVIMNLCTNAAHAMEESGGVLALQLAPVSLTGDDLKAYADLHEGPYVRLSVRDTGTGIPEEIQGRIFDPFFTTKEVGRGTGMGLAVVHGIVKSLGGDITFYSEEGRGTVFHVLIPRVCEEALPEADAAREFPRGTESVLLLDDEEMLLDMEARLLRLLGYRVTARQNAAEAYEAFKSTPQQFDIVITDQTMPNMTGFDLARRIMTVRPDIPVILCTGFSRTVSEEAALSAGIQAFIMKPLRQEELAFTVRRLLDAGKLSDEKKT